ncbi:transcription termination factor Rho [bacterium]|nr:transcription termination factor Rho [bacterium]
MEDVTLSQLTGYRREQLINIIREANLQVAKLTRKKTEELMHIILENQDKIKSLPEPEPSEKRRGRKPQYSQESQAVIEREKSSSEYKAVEMQQKQNKTDAGLPEQSGGVYTGDAETRETEPAAQASSRPDAGEDKSEQKEAEAAEEAESSEKKDPSLSDNIVLPRIELNNYTGTVRVRHKDKQGRRQGRGALAETEEDGVSPRTENEGAGEADEAVPYNKSRNGADEGGYAASGRRLRDNGDSFVREGSRFSPRTDKKNNSDSYYSHTVVYPEPNYNLGDIYTGDDIDEVSIADNCMPTVTGILDLRPKGFGLLRGRSYKIGENDVRVSMGLIKKHCLRMGDMICGKVRSVKHGESGYELENIISVNGISPENAARRQTFEQLVPIYPNETYILEGDDHDMTARVIDLFAPIGKGQRALIVSPPKAGKTICLKKIAAGISANFPESILIALLVDERPEEVTDMERSIRGSVVSSTFDADPMQHISISYLVLQRACRLAEMGKDVVILLDSLTRLGRACNNVAPNSGRTMSGGLDSSALRMPKRFFGSARKFEKGGSLTIIATALIETGSRMDEVIFEEFKGTGNNEINLSRKLAERRVFPAIDIKKSSTRHDELLQDEDTLETMTLLRRNLDTLSGEREPTEVIIENLRKTVDNADFLGRFKRNRTSKP